MNSDHKLVTTFLSLSMREAMLSMGVVDNARQLDSGRHSKRIGEEDDKAIGRWKIKHDKGEHYARQSGGG